ncbi:hypothetical protein [Streptomyces sp. ICBB 8177]|uniref:hypothetical protein n=1 Tax=Streptomyces sp. ICBB 8177 TaxID=563922 RepID=UPI001F541394|nr:hypothetical protein [Streptomyces sp. ICBB 8177]
MSDLSELPELEPRRFYLQRHLDVTGASGTGVVAWGVAWPDGSASIRWVREPASVVFWPGGVTDAEWVHSHGGATEVVWIDGQTTAREAEAS